MADESGVESETQNKPEPTPLQWKCLDFGWVIFTWPGRFKAAEFLTAILGVICIASANVFDKEPRYEFFVFVGVFSWIVICVHMILGIPHLIERLPLIVTQPLVFFVCCALAVLVWLIASSVVVARDKNSSAIKAGGAFGFITMFLFLFEAVYYFVLWRKGGSVRRQEPSKEMDDPAAGNDYVPDNPGY